MGLDETSASTIRRAQEDQPGEACMVDQERGAQIRRLFHEERVSISQIGRRWTWLARRCGAACGRRCGIRIAGQRLAETLLTAHADLVWTRAPQVGYSARILYQELQASRRYTGSYETVKRWPLRENGEPKYLMGLVAGTRNLCTEHLTILKPIEIIIK